MRNPIKGFIRQLAYWAFELEADEDFSIDTPVDETLDTVYDSPLELPIDIEPMPLTAGNMQAYMEDQGATFFCKARPGLPGEIEHIHQMPNTEADKQRAKDFGFMVDDICLIPAAPFVFFDGNGIIGREGNVDSRG